MVDRPGYAEAGTHHEDVHRLAREMVVLVNRGERGKAMQLMHAFNDARTGLFGELDTFVLRVTPTASTYL